MVEQTKTKEKDVVARCKQQIAKDSVKVNFAKKIVEQIVPKAKELLEMHGKRQMDLLMIDNNTEGVISSNRSQNTQPGQHFQDLPEDESQYENHFKLLEALEEQFREVTLAYKDIKNQKIQLVQSYLGGLGSDRENTASGIEEGMGQENRFDQKSKIVPQYHCEARKEQMYGVDQSTQRTHQATDRPSFVSNSSPLHESTALAANISNRR